METCCNCLLKEAHKNRSQIDYTCLTRIFLQEVKREEFEQQMALASNAGRRDDRDRDRDRRRPRDNRGPQMSDEGWSTVASTKGRAFDSSRLKTFTRVSPPPPPSFQCKLLIHCNCFVKFHWNLWLGTLYLQVDILVYLCNYLNMICSIDFA